MQKDHPLASKKVVSVHDLAPYPRLNFVQGEYESVIFQRNYSAPVSYTHLLSGLTQFFFSGFNTAIYAIIPDRMEYGEWKTGLRNDAFQYAFISLGHKIRMAVGTAFLAGLLGNYGYIANQTQNAIVLSIMKHAFTTIPGALWIVTAVVLFFYRLNKKRYNLSLIHIFFPACYASMYFRSISYRCFGTA